MDLSTLESTSRLRSQRVVSKLVIPLYLVIVWLSGEMFYDITVGNTSLGGDKYDCGNGFVAADGWDSATGWGSPRWAGLVKYLSTDN